VAIIQPTRECTSDGCGRRTPARSGCKPTRDRFFLMLPREQAWRVRSAPAG
jgi:hypothetical protein